MKRKIPYVNTEVENRDFKYYIFDWDDNILHMPTKIRMEHREDENGEWKPVVGLVENMSYLKCPDCGKAVAVFGESKAESLAKKFAIPETVRLPIDPSFASAIDVGAAETIEIPDFDSFARRILK